MKTSFQQNIIPRKVFDVMDCYFYFFHVFRLVYALVFVFVFLSTDTLALPKLNLQFLTLHDYLLRNLNLFRLESTCM